MKKIGVVTSNRADYGLLTPLIRRIEEDPELELQLLVTGSHLSPKYGMTIDEILKDGFRISAKLPILEDGNSPYDVSVTVANAIREFANYFRVDRPDIIVILGDRTEMLGVAIAALNENIPIAHIHGGEVTEGAVDDCIRHAITKMSYLHFAGTEIYRRRIIQMGENPERVYNVGTLGAENILKASLWDEDTLRKDVGIPANMPYAVVTLHPETINGIEPKKAANLIVEMMRDDNEHFYVITASNADVGGDTINSVFQTFADETSNAVYIKSLGMIRYLSAVKHASFIMGNSSSGILEAPILGTPTINLGDRQSGRIMADTVVNVPYERIAIRLSIKKIGSIKHNRTMIFGDGKTSEKIVEILKQSLIDGVRKNFYTLTY